MLTFEETPLSNVAAEFNRYNRRRLIVDPAVAKPDGMRQAAEAN